MKKTLWFWLCFVLTVVLAVYFSVRIVMTGMGRGPVATVKNISVSADTDDKNITALVAATTLVPGSRSYAINLKQINERVAAVPGVKESAVRRMPNGNLSIKVSTHKAVALWSDGEKYFPLSADGIIVNTPTDERLAGHIVFRGAVPTKLSEITQTVSSMASMIDFMEWVENRRWNIHTVNGITVMLPETAPDMAVNTLITLNNNHQILAKDLSVIDMRDSARILVK